MKLPTLKHYCLFIFWIPYFLIGQGAEEEILRKNRELLSSQHENIFGNLRDVISGREHRAVYHFTNGHPFWGQKSWILGSVQTTLHHYPNLTIRYDLYKDVLLYLPDSLSVDFLAVNPNLVSNFTLNDVVFVNLGKGEEAQAMDNIEMDPGYYEWVYKGKSNLFAKNWKELKSKSGDARVHSEFYDRRVLYIYREDTFYRIKKKKELLHALSPHRAAIKTYVRKERIPVRKITDIQFINLLRYYDSL